MRQETLGAVSIAKSAIVGVAGLAYFAAMESLDFVFLAVPASDVLFVLGTVAYLWGLNRFRFASNAEAMASPPPRLSNLPWVRGYALSMASIGLLLPWAVLLSDPRAKAPVMAPHLYLLMAQLGTEALSQRLRWALPVRQLVPLAFNLFRLKSLWVWMRVVTFAPPGGLVEPFSAGERILAAANFCAWSCNVFGFLLPQVLPELLRATHRPWASADEVEAEAAELRALADRRREREQEAAGKTSAAPSIPRATSGGAEP